MLRLIQSPRHISDLVPDYLLLIQLEPDLQLLLDLHLDLLVRGTDSCSLAHLLFFLQIVGLLLLLLQIVEWIIELAAHVSR